MKMQPELEVIARYHDPCHADNREAYPALQTVQVDCAAAESRHDHILRAALLASGRVFPGPRRQ